MHVARSADLVLAPHAFLHLLIDALMRRRRKKKGRIHECALYGLASR
jgi:hypothetical protein